MDDASEGFLKPTREQKISAASKKMWENPEFKKLHASDMKHVNTPEDFAKRSERLRLAWEDGKYDGIAISRNLRGTMFNASDSLAHLFTRKRG